MNKKVFIFVVFVFIVAFVAYIAGMIHGMDYTTDQCINIADKFLNMSLTPQGKTVLKMYFARAGLNWTIPD